jgi:hypothetical protein
MRNQKNITDREQLKSFFKKGNLPSESAFAKLIDSTFNIAEDKLDINEDGIMIYPSDNGEEKLLSFFEDKDDAEAMWSLFISKTKEGGIYIQKTGNIKNKNNAQDDIDEPAVFIQKNEGKVGLGTSTPDQKLDVKGFVASEGRVGNYKEGELDADGYWHNIFKDKPLTGSNAFEIMAYAEGKEGDGKYALMHAITISTFGNSKPKITKTSACFGNNWNKIDIRWVSKPSQITEQPDEDKKKFFDLAKWWKTFREPKDPFRYNLQLKTKSHYGPGKKIRYKVSVLWNDGFLIK